MLLGMILRQWKPKRGITGNQLHVGCGTGATAGLIDLNYSIFYNLPGKIVVLARLNFVLLSYFLLIY